MAKADRDNAVAIFFIGALLGTGKRRSTRRDGGSGLLPVEEGQHADQSAIAVDEVVLEGGGALGPLFRGHREGAVEGADGAFEVCRRHRLPMLLMKG